MTDADKSNRDLTREMYQNYRVSLFTLSAVESVSVSVVVSVAAVAVEVGVATAAVVGLVVVLVFIVEVIVSLFAAPDNADTQMLCLHAFIDTFFIHSTLELK